MRKLKEKILIISFSIGVDVLGFPQFWKHKLSSNIYENTYNQYYNSFKRYIKTPTN